MSGQSAGSSTSLTALRQLQGAETPGPAGLTDLASSVTLSWIPRRRLSPTARGSTEPRPSLPKSPSAPPASPFGAAGSRRLAPADSPVAAAPRAPSLRQRTPAEPPAALPSRQTSRLEKVQGWKKIVFQSGVPNSRMTRKERFAQRAAAARSRRAAKNLVRQRDSWYQRRGRGAPRYQLRLFLSSPEAFARGLRKRVCSLTPPLQRNTDWFCPLISVRSNCNALAKFRRGLRKCACSPAKRS